jgi:L,D-transpeptidase YcbB
MLIPPHLIVCSLITTVLLAGLTVQPSPAPAQTSAGSPPTAEAADPLTPPTLDVPQPTAPGAVAAPTAGQPSVTADPAITRLLQQLATGAATRATAEDRAAVAAFYAENGGQPIWTNPAGLTPRALAATEELARAANYGLDSPDAYRLATTPAASASVEPQADQELALSVAALTYARHARGGRLDPAKISAIIDMRPRPYEPKSVLASLAVSADVAATLRSFQPQHMGFQSLQAAYVAARAAKAPVETLQRLQVNLERWRWLPDDLGAFHIINNVPEQITRVYKNGTPIFTERIVVGKPGHSTPLMTADLLYVIFHPSWGVPNGIKTKEVGPMLARASARNAVAGVEGKRAASALGRHELRVLQNGRELDPDTVDWRTADIRQFHFTQAPSKKNVLGVVKFRFPNRYDVYMHDTQERHLFSHGVRAYSHGCMRVQNPMQLAETILGHDKGWTGDKVRGFVGSGRTADITLTTPVPVHLVYFTASADAAGKLSLHGDIYGMDQRVASALAGKPIALAAAKVSSEPVAPRRAVARTDRDAADGFNPFSGPTSGLSSN